MIETLIITICWVIILDQLHFWDEISTSIKSMMTGGKMKSPIDIKPFNCSTCMSFWTNLAYIIVTNQFSVQMILYILLLSWTTPIINAVFSFVKNLILKVINIISDFLKI